MADYNSGSDAAYIKPRLLPQEALHPIDDSLPPDDRSQSRYAEFGDGGDITYPKSHLMVRKGK